ncbi:MAG: alpha/beta hydrolase [Bacteroidetes bacterium]|nr:alpha/beta hydrolase [Bacteroidota bacterium]
MWKLIIAFILFLFSLLTVVKAPTNLLWKAAVAITEFPYIFIFASLLFLILSFKSSNYKVILLIINGITLTLYCLPVIRAYQRSINLQEELALIFPSSEKNHLEQPYSFLKMFSGIHFKKTLPTIIKYKALSEKDLNLDFYSAGNIKAPCVIVIHGGSWSQGDNKQLPDLNHYLASKGYHVAAINYRLSPKYKSPAQVEDTRDALNYLIKYAYELNIDTANFVLLGRSAGGQIALVSAYTFNDPHIKGVVSFYAPADMVWGGRVKVGKLVLNTEKVFNEFLGGTIDQVPEKFKESSALEYVNKNSTPTLIIHGENDAMVSFEHGIHLDKKLSDNAVKHYFLNLPWATHGCDYNINEPSGQLSTYTIERFINSVTSE